MSRTTAAAATRSPSSGGTWICVRRRRFLQRPGDIYYLQGVAAHPVWSVSVDVDGLGCYAAIHGLSLRLDERGASAPCPSSPVQRFCELFAALGVHATFSSSAATRASRLRG